MTVQHVKAAHEGEVLEIAHLEIRPQEGLVLAGDRVVRREDLYALVWKAPLREGDRTIDVYVHKLRSKLEGALPGEQFIHTHVGFGYRFSHESSHPFHTPATGR